MITELDKEEAVERAKEVLRERTFEMGLECDVLFHYEQGGRIYVISNPVMGTDRTILDDGTRALIPRRNLCIEYKDHLLNASILDLNTDNDRLLLMFGMEMRLMPVLAPQLIILIDVSGEEIVIKEATHHERQ